MNAGPEAAGLRQAQPTAVEDAVHVWKQSYELSSVAAALSVGAAEADCLAFSSQHLSVSY